MALRSRWKSVQLSEKTAVAEKTRTILSSELWVSRNVLLRGEGNCVTWFTQCSPILFFLHLNDYISVKITFARELTLW